MVKWDSGGLPQSPQLMGDTGTRLKINLEKFMRLNLNKRFVSQNTRNGESSDSATCEIVISSMEFGIGSKWFTNVRLSYVTEYRCQTSTSPSSYHPDVSLPRESKIGERGPTWNSSPLTEQLPVYSGSEREGALRFGLKRFGSVRTAEAVPEHSVQEAVRWASAVSERRDELAHHQANHCSCETTEKALWQWGPALARSHHTMAACIYL